ncbi:MAG: beta-agarase, partial [Rhodanobacter sp.]
VHALDKPVLVSEFHFGSDDRGPFGKGVVSVWNEAQRGPAYAKFIAAAAQDPVIVGAHWFQYTDQPVSGRLLDGENSHVGLVGITDIPFQGFVTDVRLTNGRAKR